MKSFKNIYNFIRYLGTRTFVYKYFPTLFLFFKFGVYKNINQEKYWDQVHQAEKSHQTTRFGKRVYKILKRNINFNHKSILDVGCGKGDFLLSIKENCLKYGVDISQSAVNYLKNKGIRVKRRCLPDIGFKKEFDIITCFETLEHVENWKKTLLIIISRLKSDGYMIISVPFENRIVIREHINYFDVQRLYSFLRNKLEILEIKFLGPWFLIIGQKMKYEPKHKEKILGYHLNIFK